MKSLRRSSQTTYICKSGILEVLQKEQIGNINTDAYRVNICTSLGEFQKIGQVIFQINISEMRPECEPVSDEEWSPHRMCRVPGVSWAGTTVLPLLGAGPGDVLQFSVRPGISNSKHITSVLIIIITRNLITVSENGARRTDQSVSPAIPLVTREREMWASL